MEWKEALPLLQESHTGVAVSVTPKGRAHATVVSTAVLDGKVGFASRGHTVKVRNIQRTGRAAVTVIKLDTRRYVTVEGPTTVEPWKDTPEHLQRLKALYVAMGRTPKTDEEFARRMREEQRALVLVSPERIYGSL
ncbi:MAG TPA: pyridoxamine 5'-phosphate oxidase family protein [candidate division Zixibacteria bacterium]|nr:pyridoxamine 5'-phosphate oxidase family protein [candidate division Zixibacteria bacterium]